MASVHRQKGSPYWAAKVRVWVPLETHPDGGFWRRTLRSTRIPLSDPKERALDVAREIERTSKAAFNTQDPTLFFEQALGRMLFAAGRPQHKTTSWRQWSETWLTSQTASPETVKRYRNAVDDFSEHLGARAGQSLRLITPTDCAAFYQGMLDRGLKQNTVVLLYKAVRWCLGQAQLHGHLERNPAALMKVKKHSEFQRKPFSPEDITKIFAQIKAHETSQWRIACLFGLYYGMRLKDATGRRYEEIRMDDGIRVIEFEPGKKKKKGEKARKIKLPLIGELAGLRGKGPITPLCDKLGNASKVFSRILRDAGVEVQVLERHGKGGHSQADKSFHSFRHTTNTMLANAGVDTRLRQLISDHESAEMNNLYTHPNLEAMQKALEPMAKIKV